MRRAPSPGDPPASVEATRSLLMGAVRPRAARSPLPMFTSAPATDPLVTATRASAGKQGFAGQRMLMPWARIA